MHILSTLAHVLGILLLVVFGLLVLFQLLLVPRTGVHVWAKNGDLRVKVRYGRVLVLLFPRHRKEGKPKPQKPAPPPKEKPAEDKPKRTLNWRALDLGDTVCFLLDLLLQMKDTLRLDIVRADVVLATGDAGKTGRLLGSLSAGVSMLYAFLMEHFNLKTCHIAIDGDFEGRDTRYDAEVSLSLRPIAMEWVILRNSRKLYRLYKTLMKTETIKTEKTEAETT